MGRPEKPVDSNGAIAAFARDLRLLRKHAGNPTYRELAQIALFSSSVLSSAAGGYRLPTLQVTLAFVAACGGDREVWERRWHQVSAGGKSTFAGQTEATARAAATTGRGCGSLPRPAQLPMRPRGFPGRTVELHRLAAEMDHSLVAISGPTGVGKSEFALRYAHHLVPRMPDGHLYADLHATECQAALTGFLHALGVSGSDLLTSLHQQAGIYRTLLAERRLVVLLDNVQAEHQVRPLLAETQRSVTIIVSKQPLLGLRDVHRVTLGALVREESIAMIAATAANQADFDACNEIAELCGDLPLALDIAARRLAANPELRPRELAARLRDPRRLLNWLRLGDLSMVDTLTRAFALLSEQAAALLGHLAERTSGEFRLPGNASGEGVEELLAELVEAGMLRRGEGWGSYRLDTLVRAFIEDRLTRLRTWHLLAGVRINGVDDLIIPQGC